MNFPFLKQIAQGLKHANALIFVCLTLACTVRVNAYSPSCHSSNSMINVAVPDTLFALSEEEQKALPHLRLTGQIMFQVLAAEIALQRGQLAPAYRTYLILAYNTHDPRLAQRATEIALSARSTVDALT